MPPARPSSRNRILSTAALVLAVVAATAWWGTRDRVADKGRYRTATIERGDIRVAISATGTLSAISTVDVGSQISGQGTDVLVDFNDRVT
jgi:HlyD family secretion protein